VRGARYDANGDIVLPPEETVLDGEPVPVHARKNEPKFSGPNEKILKNDRPVRPPRFTKQPGTPAIPALPGFSKRLKGAMKEALSDSFSEGKRQVSATLGEAQENLVRTKISFKSLPVRMRGSVRRFWKSMSAPVQLTSHKPGKHRKPPTKLKLFVVDTVRFGGTFAGIFIVLFVGINYQSFWQIAKAQLALSGDLKNEQALQQMVQGNSYLTPGMVGTTMRQGDTANLLAYLPPVGPFENRLVIPKLDKNIPIVRPSMDALMHEDWKKFEEDIQTALHDGAVHYPGSARPGQAGNFFVTAHSSYYPWDNGKYKDSFARLNDLALGDTYSVYYNGDKHTYRVTAKKEVSPNNVTVLDQPTNKRLATLMTCTPVGTTLRRLIVTAEEIDPANGSVLRVGERPEENIGQNLFSRLETLPI